jgi:hypothetical protein
MAVRIVDVSGWLMNDRRLGEIRRRLPSSIRFEI